MRIQVGYCRLGQPYLPNSGKPEVGYRTRNLEIPDLRLAAHPGMTVDGGVISSPCRWPKPRWGDFSFGGLQPSGASLASIFADFSASSFEPVQSPRRLTANGCGLSRGRRDVRRDVMRMIAKSLLTASLVLVTAFAGARARAADVEAASAVDAVTVYPDGASVTRVMTLDLPAGDNTLVA